MTSFNVGAQLSLTQNTLSPGIQILIAQLNQLNQTFVNINQKVSQTFIAIDRSVTTTINNVGRQVSMLDGLLTKLTAFFAAFKAVQFIRDAVNEFAEFERGIALVAAQADKSKISLDQVRDAVLELGRQTGRPFTELNRALRDTVSSGIELSDALKVVRVAAEFAAAGGTTVDDAVRGIITAVNAFELSITDATKVADTFFQAMKTGRATAADLARFLGVVAPVAHEAGLSLDETVNALNALTLSGLSSERAATSLRSALITIIKPTAEASALAQRLGLDFTTTALSAKGLAGFLADVTAKTEGDKVAIAGLFGNYRAYTAILDATAKNQSALAQGFELLKDKAGALGRAFGIVGESFAITQDRFFRSFEALQINFGRATEPVLRSITKLLTDLFDLVSTNEGSLRGFFERLAVAITALNKAVQSAFEEGQLSRLIGASIRTAIGVLIDSLIAAVPVVAEAGLLFGRTIGKSIIEGIFGEVTPVAFGGIAAIALKKTRDDLVAEIAKLQQDAIEATKKGAGAGGVIQGLLQTKIDAKREELKQIEAQLAKSSGVDATAFRKSIDDAIEQEKKIVSEALQKLAGESTGKTRSALNETADAFANVFSGPDAITKGTESGHKFGQSIVIGITTAFDQVKTSFANIGKTLFPNGISLAGVQKDIDTEQAKQKLLGDIKLLEVAERNLAEARRITSDLASKNLITGAQAAEREKDAVDKTKEAFAGVDATIAQLDPGQKRVLGDLLAHIDTIRLKTKETRSEFDNLGQGIVQGLIGATNTLADLNKLGIQLGETFANSFADLVVQFARGQRAFSQFAGEFLQKIGEMILKAAIFRAIQGGLNLLGLGAASAGEQSLAFDTANPELAEGGWIDGPDTRRDSTLIAAMPGEFMVRRAAATDYYGGGIMQAINDMVIPRDALIPYATNLRMNLGTGRATGGFAPSATVPAAGGPSRAYLFPDEQAAERTLAAAPEVYTRFMREHRSALGYGSGRTR